MHLASLCANIAPVNANTGCDWHSGCDILRRDLASEQNAAKSNFNKCIKQNRTTRVAHSYVCSNCSDADLICILTWQTQFKRHFPFSIHHQLSLCHLPQHLSGLRSKWPIFPGYYGLGGVVHQKVSPGKPLQLLQQDSYLSPFQHSQRTKDTRYF